jgi:hypothetical protein
MGLMPLRQITARGDGLQWTLGVVSTVMTLQEMMHRKLAASTSICPSPSIWFLKKLNFHSHITLGIRSERQSTRHCHLFQRTFSINFTMLQTYIFFSLLFLVYVTSSLGSISTQLTTGIPYFWRPGCRHGGGSYYCNCLYHSIQGRH